LISAAFAASIVTCFAPGQDCAALAIGAIDAAEHEVLVHAYVFTTGSGIPAALIRAHDRGVDVRLVADRWTPCTQQEGVTALARAGVPICEPGRVCERDTTLSPGKNAILPS
jgi:phosphatidylserine/phosphatidylglycerophosphate/cardiolipin synthase-like enzyme